MVEYAEIRDTYFTISFRELFVYIFPQSPEFIEMLTKQLNTTVTVALQKYNNKR